MWETCEPFKEIIQHQLKPSIQDDIIVGLYPTMQHVGLAAMRPNGIGVIVSIIFVGSIVDVKCLSSSYSLLLEPMKFSMDMSDQLHQLVLGYFNQSGDSNQLVLGDSNQSISTHPNPPTSHPNQSSSTHPNGSISTHPYPPIHLLFEKQPPILGVNSERLKDVLVYSEFIGALQYACYQIHPIWPTSVHLSELAYIL